MTNKIIKAASNGIATANDCRPAIEFLSRLADAHPELRPAVQELKSKHEYLDTLCQTIIGIAQSMGKV